MGEQIDGQTYIQTERTVISSLLARAKNIQSMKSTGAAKNQT